MDGAGDEGNGKTWISGAKCTCFPGMSIRRGETGADSSRSQFLSASCTGENLSSRSNKIQYVAVSQLRINHLTYIAYIPGAPPPQRNFDSEI